jgi:hypothetical protein
LNPQANGFNNLLLGKLSIPRSDEELNVTSEIVKENNRIIELNEIVFTKKIDVKASSGKTAFNKVEGCKTKDHQHGNAASA